MAAEMKNTGDADAALKVLNDFMHKMNAWECEFFRVRKRQLDEGEDDPSTKALYKEELEKILESFAIKDKSNFGRLIDLGCTNPPTYDPDSDIVEVVSALQGEVVIRIEQTVGVQLVSRITMVSVSGLWKIKKKEDLGYDDKWKRSPL